MYCSKPIIAFFSSFTRSDILSIIGIFVAISAVFIFIWWEKRKKRQDIIDAFIQPLLRLKTIIETKSIPARDVYEEFIRQFSIHENAMSVIRYRMADETKSAFDEKWADYKNERDKYKNYWDTNLKGKFSVHKRSNQLITVINELIKIANKI